MNRAFVILACAALGCLQAAEQRGTVRSAGLPIPGAAITAAQGDQKLTVYTDEQGSYVFENLPPGAWKLETEMFGFQPAELTINMADLTPPPLDLVLKLKTAPRIVAAAPKVEAPQPAEAPKAAEAKPEAAKPAPARATARPGGAANSAGRAGAANGTRPGFQPLAVNQTLQSDIQAALSAPAPEPVTQEVSQNANESFLVTGSLSRGLQDAQREDFFAMGMGMPGMNPGMNPEMQGMGGTPGGQAPGGGPGGAPGGGGPGMMGGGGPMGGGGGMGGGFGGRGGMMGGGPGGRPGGPGGPGARGGPGGRPAFADRTPFGNRANRARDGLHGGAFFSLRNSALDAKPYSLTGQNILKPSYAQTRFGGTIGGPLNIPHVIKDDKTFFFLNFSLSRSRNPYDSNSTLPSALERAGDFSQSVAHGPVTVYDPATRQPFAGNVIPASRINAAARQLLALFPLPNLAGRVQNYEYITSAAQNSLMFSGRLNRSITRKDRLNAGYNIQRSSSANPQLFGFRDTGSGRGQSFNVSWSHTIKAGFFNNLSMTFSRNRNQTTPFFAGGRDWAGDLGIQGTSRDTANFGPPNLSFTNFGGLSDGSWNLMRNQTVGLTDGIVKVWKKHNFSFGGDFRRTQQNSISQQSARGSMAFSGLLTSAFDAQGSPLAGTGFDLADFLLGFPQSSTIRFGNPDTYFRGSTYNFHGQDDWRLRSNLSINAGLRYELVRPVDEKYGRMANLDIAPGFTGVAVVTPGTAGPYTGNFPDALVNTDTNNLSPRIGIAWRPIPNNQLQVRAGYGVYFNGSVMNQAAGRLAQQPPFAKSGTLNTTTQNPLTIQTGFTSSPTDKITNTYAVDRFYRTGYAQTWSFSVQKNLPLSTVLELGYLGTKGTRLDIQRLPNRAPPGSPLTAEERRQIGNATGFTFDSSDGNSIYHAAQARVMRRFRNGLSANALYTFGKSIDNASTFGGGGATVAQDDKNLRAERGLSSFDRRHSLTMFWMFTTSANRRGGSAFFDTLLGKALKDWTLTGGVNIRSGSPLTAQVLGNRSDQGGTGSIGSGRADATGLPADAGTGFFNLAAFALPPATRYGSAGRNTITGPNSFSMNGSFGRTIRLKESRRSLDIRMEANNILNSVNITRIGTTVNASNYGLALGASSMRSMTANLRLRF